MDEAVYAAEVDKYAVGGDVLDGTFEYLTLFELGDDFTLLLLELSFDECFVRNDHVAELFVDFHNLEFHGLAYEYIVVADGLNVDLRAGEESLDTEHVDNHAAFSTALDEALDDFVVFEGGVDTFPRARSTSFLVREDKLAFTVFLVLDEYLYLVADFDVGVVAEFAHGDDAVGFVVDVNHSLTLVESDNGTFDYFFVFNRVERFFVSVGEFFTRFLAGAFAVFVSGPIEVFNRRIF